MCGRYVIQSSPEEISERFQLRRFPDRLLPNFNAAPTQLLPVIVESTPGEREVRLMSWGLTARWAKPGEAGPRPINARCETLAEKPMFRGLVARQRCIVPVNGYYEWKEVDGRKQPYLFSLTNQPLFGLAGLYDETAGPDGERHGSYTVITTDANSLAATFHDRMPAILHRNNEAEWLNGDGTPFAALQHLLAPYPANEMRIYPVSRAVSNVRVNDPTLIAEISEEEAMAAAVKPTRPTKRAATGQQTLF